MGMPFPTGLRLLERAEFGTEALPWVWSLNGAFSVFGSLVAIVLGLNYGFSIGFWVVLVFYIFAGLILFGLKQKTAN
jgi:hypothetical protein